MATSHSPGSIEVEVENRKSSSPALPSPSVGSRPAHGRPRRRPRFGPLGILIQSMAGVQNDVANPPRRLLASAPRSTPHSWSSPRIWRRPGRARHHPAFQLLLAGVFSAAANAGRRSRTLPGRRLDASPQAALSARFDLSCRPEETCPSINSSNSPPPSPGVAGVDGYRFAGAMFFVALWQALAPPADVIERPLLRLRALCQKLVFPPPQTPRWPYRCLRVELDHCGKWLPHCSLLRQPLKRPADRSRLSSSATFRLAQR